MKLATSLMLGLLASVAALLPSPAMAQNQPEPAIVISIANLDEQLKDIKYLLKASGFPEMNFLAKAAINGYTEGVDSSRNAGVSIFFTEDSPAGFTVSGFIPVDDIEALLDVIAGIAEIEDNDDASYTIIVGDGTEITVKENKGYAFFSAMGDLPAVLPAEPEKALGKLPSQYNLAFRVQPSNLPESIRKRAMDLIKESSAQTLAQLDEDLTPEQEENLQMQLAQFEQLLTDTEEFTVGMAAKEEDKILTTDITMVAKEGTKLAEKFNYAKPVEPSKFTGFLIPGAAMNANFQGRMSPEDAEIYAKMMTEGKSAIVDELNEESELSDSEFQKVENAIDNILSVLTASVKKGVIDGGAVITLEDRNPNFASGFTISEPEKLAASIKELAPMIKAKAMEEDDVEIVFNFDVGKHADVTFHEVKILIDESEEEARQVLGDAATIIIGIGTESMYVGAGKDPMTLIKKAMDSTHEKEFDSEATILISPILKFASGLDAPPEVAVMAEKLAENGGDRLRIYTKAIGNGSFTRFEMQDGILSLIKVGVEAAQNGFNNDF